MAKQNIQYTSQYNIIYTYTIYGNMAAVIYIFFITHGFFNLSKTKHWVCSWIYTDICLIAKEHRRRGFVLTSMDFNNRAYFYWQSITNLMNNIQYRERFWIWLLEPIACNKNLTLGYKKNTTVAAEATYMQLLTINMFVPKLWCVYDQV